MSETPKTPQDFAFLVGRLRSRQRRWTDPFHGGKEGRWEEFTAIQTGTTHLDGRVHLEHFEGTFPTGEVRKGLTIRTYNDEKSCWEIRWLDNRNPHDFEPMEGRFVDGKCLLEGSAISPVDGKEVKVRFTWDNITEQGARWQQFFSFDDGQTWEVNWVAEFDRQPIPDQG